MNIFYDNNNNKNTSELVCIAKYYVCVISPCTHRSKTHKHDNNFNRLVLLKFNDSLVCCLNVCYVSDSVF